VPGVLPQQLPQRLRLQPALSKQVCVLLVSFRTHSVISRFVNSGFVAGHNLLQCGRCRCGFNCGPSLVRAASKTGGLLFDNQLIVTSTAEPGDIDCGCISSGCTWQAPGFVDVALADASESGGCRASMLLHAYTGAAAAVHTLTVLFVHVVLADCVVVVRTLDIWCSGILPQSLFLLCFLSCSHAHCCEGTVYSFLTVY
jgi:hypothetical protein